jgi:hypothetical protein
MSDHEVTFTNSLDDTEGDEFPDLKPGGPMLFELNELVVKERRDGNGFFLNVELQVIDVEDDDLAANIGRKHWEIFSLSEPSMWKLKAFISKVVREDDGPLGATIDKAWCDRWVGRALIANLRTERYNGNENLRMFKFKSTDEWDGMNYKNDAEGTLVAYEEDVAPKLPGKPNGSAGAEVGTSVDI